MNKFNALETCEKMAAELGQKAGHNKNESLWSFKLIMTLTLATPILINISDDWIWGKLLPSIFAAIASFFNSMVKGTKARVIMELIPF